MSQALDQYLKILGVRDRRLSLSLLDALIRRHVATFAFSSVSCQLGNELPLEFNALFQRIVINRRGGYCFEQNALFYDLLRELGFETQLYLARVIYNRDTHPGLTHRISVVVWQGRQYVVDVGFGPLGPRQAIPMNASPVDDGNHTFRVQHMDNGDVHLQVHKDQDFFSLYRFELSRYGPSDCEMGHFYSHRHPDAAFVKHLVVCTLLADKTRSLRDLNYRVISRSNEQSVAIQSAQQLHAVLTDELGIEVTDRESQKLFKKLRSWLPETEEQP